MSSPARTADSKIYTFNEDTQSILELVGLVLELVGLVLEFCLCYKSPRKQSRGVNEMADQAAARFSVVVWVVLMGGGMAASVVKISSQADSADIGETCHILEYIYRLICRTTPTPDVLCNALETYLKNNCHFNPPCFIATMYSVCAPPDMCSNISPFGVCPQPFVCCLLTTLLAAGKPIATTTTDATPKPPLS